MPVDVQMKFYDAWGTEQTYNHMSAGWAWAFDTPFDWFKQNASRLGGTNQNMVVSWPARIKDKGGLREQFTHVIDVMPTILEVAGIRAPEIVDGIEQAPIEGTSFAYTFDAQNAKAPSQHTTQYFEMMGQWALYQDGWVLSTKVNLAPWEAFGPANPDPLNNQVFQLYNLNTDFAQAEDIAAKYPQKVTELKAQFVAEARKYQVFPLDASVAARVVAPRPNIAAGRSEFVYTRPMTGLPQGASPSLLNTSYTVTAELDIPGPTLGLSAPGGAEGMILTSGGRFGGYGFYLLKGKPVWLWNMVDLERIKWEGPDALTPGPHTIEFDFKYDGLGSGTLAFNSFSGVGRPGTGTLKVDGKVVASKTMPKTLPMILQWDESFDIGSDTLTGVNDADYKPPFPLTAKLNKLTIRIDRPQLSPADIQALQAAQRNNKMSE
jgi:arylsulfatase